MGYIHDSLVHDGYEVDYLCSDDMPKALTGGMDRFCFPALVFKRALVQARAGRPYNIINVHEPSAVAVLLGRKALGRPTVVVTSHGVERRGWNLALEDARLGRDTMRLKTRMLYPMTSLWQSAFSLRHADHIFCLNWQDRDHIVDRFGRSPADITRIFPGAADVYARAAADRDYRRSSRLVFAGSWIARKGIRDLVEAFTTLAAWHSEITLTVLGGGASPETIWSCFPAHIRKRIECVQTATDSEAAAVLADRDLFVLPSLFEGTPLTLIEAMMSGLPIVTTATCGMKDVIRDGENGILVPIRSPEAIVGAVAQLLRDAAFRERLGAAARADAIARYTWNRVSLPVHEAYERLCSSKAVGTTSANIKYVEQR